MSTTTRTNLTFKDKLRRELDRQQLGVTALAKRFVPDVHTKEFDAARRAIHKHLKGDTNPRREMRRRYEAVLGLDMGELEPDDEEADSLTLDEFLRLRTRQFVREEIAQHEGLLSERSGTDPSCEPTGGVDAATSRPYGLRSLSSASPRGAASVGALLFTRNENDPPAHLGVERGRVANERESNHDGDPDE